MGKEFFEADTRAVSPIIGTILLVGITVIAASTIAVFVFGLDLVDTACNAGFPSELEPIIAPVCP